MPLLLNKSLVHNLSSKLTYYVFRDVFTPRPVNFVRNRKQNHITIY